MPLPRLYADLAWLWPHLSPPSDYAAEAAQFDALLTEHLGPGPQHVLELGAGGGHTLVHLDARAHPSYGRGRHHTAAVDLSPAMLAHAAKLIPGLAVHTADMRSLNLGETFDAILLHDAVDYLLSEDDLDRTFAAARAHLRPGGLLFVAPTYYRETFVAHDVAADVADADGRPVPFFTHVHDPDPADTTVEMRNLILLPDASDKSGRNGFTTVEDRHVLGLFPYETWTTRLEAAGFADVRPVEPEGDAAWELLLGRA